MLKKVLFEDVTLVLFFEGIGLLFYSDDLCLKFYINLICWEKVMEKKTYLVTGGAGFIGSNFIIYMLTKYKDINIINLDGLTYAGNLGNLNSVKNNENYFFVKANICDLVSVEEVFKKYDIDYVVNFAAESHVDRSIKNPDIFFKTNVLGCLNIVLTAKKAWETADCVYKKGVKFLHVSTDEVYGSLGEAGCFSEKTKLDPHSPYSASKASSDLLVKAYFDTYGFPMNITRCSNNYGPYQFPEKLIPLSINNALNLKSLPVYGDGLQIRDWLYVLDHCRAIDVVLKNGRIGEVYNIGGNNEKCNIDIVKMIINYLNQNVDEKITEKLITHITDRKGHDRRYAIDSTKIKKELGWEPSVCFEDGIKKTIDWYIKNKEWLKEVVSGEYEKYYENMYKSGGGI